MKSTFFCAFFCSLISFPLIAATPLPVILDTDMSGDCDDVGALAILNKMSDFGETKILACIANGHDKDNATAASIDVINNFYGRSQTPIGTYQGPLYPATQSPYTAHLRDEFPHTALADDKEPKALDIYRKALASSEDNSVTIISIGFLINLRELLQSQADSSSPLDGTQLVIKKVKQLVVMGGKFPKSDPNQGEYNFACQGGGPDTQFVIERWPTPILFSGFEIGLNIQTGTTLVSASPSDPVRRAYELYTNFKGRPSWDLTAVLAAVRDPNLYWSVQSSGYCKVNSNGTNEWLPAPTKYNHSYLVAKVPTTDIGNLLDHLLLLPPKNTSSLKAN